MKKRVFAFALVIALVLLNTAAAEGFWSFLSGAAEPVFTPVELPSQEDLSIIGISPKGDTLAFGKAGFGLIRDGVFTPFTRNESRGVRDEYGALDDWEERLPSFLNAIDDPVWSPDGRWVILTSYYTWTAQFRPVFPVLIDTQTREYFLLYSAPFKHGSISDFVAFSAAVFSPDSRQLMIVLYESSTLQEKPMGLTLFRWDVNTGERTDFSLSVADNFLEPFMDELSEQYSPDEIVTLQEQFADGRDPLFLMNPAFLLSDGSILCSASSHMLKNGALMMARIHFTEPGSAVLELLPTGAAEAYDSNVFAVANQQILTYHMSGRYDRSVIPYFSTGVIGEASKCFFFLCGYSDDAEYPSALLLESTPEEIAEYPLIEWLQHSLTILDFAISPDGQSAVMHARYQSFEYLLHLRLDDLRLTTLLMTTGHELPPSAYGNTVSNNHFIWSECGTILMTAGGKTYAFRLD